MRASRTSALPSPRHASVLPGPRHASALRTRPRHASTSPARRAATGKKENLRTPRHASTTPARRPPETSTLPAGADAKNAKLSLLAAEVGGQSFVRGGLYDRYSALRNERLKFKQDQSASAPAAGDKELHDLFNQIVAKLKPYHVHARCHHQLAM